MTPMNEDAVHDFKGFHSGFVALMGAPNAGKSTLLNRLLGTKISITSRKPQTTRNRILGIVHRPSAQLVFIDTPGVHLAQKPLNVRIVDAALSALSDVDVVLLMADAQRPDRQAETFLLDRLSEARKPVVLAVNKIDGLAAKKVMEILGEWSKGFSFEHILPISALHGTQVDDLLQVLEGMLPEGPPFFGEDMLTDSAERFIVAELIREKVFRLTGEEIPYAAAVTVDTFKEVHQGKTMHISATIHVERDSQKGIVIGRGGRKLKQIGQAAREDIERLLDTRVYLELFVRVQKNWTRDTRALRKFGY
jgi:GTP-binding protein Era